MRWGSKTLIDLPLHFATPCSSYMSSSYCSSSASSSSASPSSTSASYYYPSASSYYYSYSDLFPLPMFLHLLPDPCIVALIHQTFVCVVKAKP